MEERRAGERRRGKRRTVKEEVKGRGKERICAHMCMQMYKHCHVNLLVIARYFPISLSDLVPLNPFFPLFNISIDIFPKRKLQKLRSNEIVLALVSKLNDQCCLINNQVIIYEVNLSI